MRVSRMILVAAFIAIMVPVAHAQEVQLSPYIGAAFSSKVANTAKFKQSPVYGVRWSVYIIPQFSLEANLGRQNDFRFDGTSGTTHAYHFDFNSLYYFNREGPKAEPVTKFAPYVTAGIGMLNVSGNQVFTVAGGKVVTTVPAGTTSRTLVLGDGARYLSFNYGGGIQGTRLAGPVGVRFDARGKTVPNLLGGAAHFMEISAGLTFTLSIPEFN